MELLTSRLLPVPHAFSTREGGVSEGPYASLNLGFSTGDDRGRVTENTRRLAHAVGVTPDRLFTVSQVHGAALLEGTTPSTEELAPVLGEADAVTTSLEGAAVGVKTADCLPILLVDPDHHRVTAVHSGWRGTDLEISARAVEDLVKKGARPERLLAAIGPAIRACCYEVSEELAARFQAKFGPEVIQPNRHLDLQRAVELTLKRAGVRAEHIDTLPQCTSCDPAFFSHRRDQGVTGRHLSLAVCRF